MFFAATGLLLNHSDWFKSSRKSKEPVSTQLSNAEIETALSQLDQETALSELAQHHFPLKGSFQSAELFPDEAFLKFTGSKGSSDVYIDLLTGDSEYETKSFGMVEIMHNLHKGKNSGKAWQLFIDVSAILILIIALSGFILMLFIKFRLITSLVLVGSSAAVFIGIYIILVQ